MADDVGREHVFQTSPKPLSRVSPESGEFSLEELWADRKERPGNGKLEANKFLNIYKLWATRNFPTKTLGLLADAPNLAEFGKKRNKITRPVKADTNLMRT